jgi:hypothetical protein
VILFKDSLNLSALDEALANLQLLNRPSSQTSPSTPLATTIIYTNLTTHLQWCRELASAAYIRNGGKPLDLASSPHASLRSQLLLVKHATNQLISTPLHAPDIIHKTHLLLKEALDNVAVSKSDYQISEGLPQSKENLIKLFISAQRYDLAVALATHQKHKTIKELLQLAISVRKPSTGFFSGIFSLSEDTWVVKAREELEALDFTALPEDTVTTKTIPTSDSMTLSSPPFSERVLLDDLSRLPVVATYPPKVSNMFGPPMDIPAEYLPALRALRNEYSINERLDTAKTSDPDPQRLQKRALWSVH